MRLGEAKIMQTGSHVTVVASQLMLHRSLEAVAVEGIEVEVIDVRSFVPLDKASILTSLAKTNLLVVVEEAPHQAGWGGDIASLATNEGVYWLAAPVRRVNMGGALIAYSPPLEDEVLPNVGRITRAIRSVLAE
jgi:pyruvate dehydrogenase E1 component beta subunit